MSFILPPPSSSCIVDRRNAIISLIPCRKFIFLVFFIIFFYEVIRRDAILEWNRFPPICLPTECNSFLSNFTIGFKPQINSQSHNLLFAFHFCFDTDFFFFFFNRGRFVCFVLVNFSFHYFIPPFFLHFETKQIHQFLFRWTFSSSYKICCVCIQFQLKLQSHFCWVALYSSEMKITPLATVKFTYEKKPTKMNVFHWRPWSSCLYISTEN